MPAGCVVCCSSRRSGCCRFLNDSACLIGGKVDVTFDVALPDPDDVPVQFCQFLDPLAIALLVGSQLGAPLAGIRTAEVFRTVSGAAVPEATIDEHHDATTRKDDVGSETADLSTEPEPETASVKRSPKLDLRRSVPYCSSA